MNIQSNGGSKLILTVVSLYINPGFSLVGEGGSKTVKITPCFLSFLSYETLSSTQLYMYT